jgi:hypothetical protein
MGLCTHVSCWHVVPSDCCAPRGARDARLASQRDMPQGGRNIPAAARRCYRLAIQYPGSRHGMQPRQICLPLALAADATRTQLVAAALRLPPRSTAASDFFRISHCQVEITSPVSHAQSRCRQLYVCMRMCTLNKNLHLPPNSTTLQNDTTCYHNSATNCRN